MQVARAMCIINIICKSQLTAYCVFSSSHDISINTLRFLSVLAVRMPSASSLILSHFCSINIATKHTKEFITIGIELVNVAMYVQLYIYTLW